MIVMELSLVGLGLAFLLAHPGKRALVFGLSSLLFLCSLFIGSLALLLFGVAVLAYGAIEGHFLSAKSEVVVEPTQDATGLYIRTPRG